MLGALGAAGSLASGIAWGALAGLGLLSAVIAAFTVIYLLPNTLPIPLPEKVTRLLGDAKTVSRAWLSAPRSIARTLAASLLHWTLAGLIVCSLVSAFGGEIPWTRAFGVFPIALLAGKWSSKGSGP